MTARLDKAGQPPEEQTGGIHLTLQLEFRPPRQKSRPEK
jgi:hypothetical protein